MTKNTILDTPPVPAGGTGKNSFTPNTVICTGTTALGTFQNVASTGAAASILQSQGASALPQMVAITNRLLGFQYLTNTSSSTYTPTSTTVNNILVECLGGGGGGGGGGIAGGGGGVGASGGASGGYCRKWITSIGSSYTATYQVGSGGAGATAGNNNGTPGNASTWSDGTVSLSSGGGGGGTGFNTNAIATVVPGGTPGVTTGGDVNWGGAPGYVGSSLGGSSCGGPGGAGIYGGSGNPVFISSGFSNGTAGSGYGSGGSGGASTSGSTATSGGTGSNGIIIVWEYS